MSTPTPETTESVIRAAAGRRLLDELGPRPNAQQRLRAASHRWLTPELGARLARSTSRAQRRALASNRHLDPTLLARLARDPDLNIQQDALANPSCPYGIVAEHGSASDRLAHPDCPGDALLAALSEPHLQDLALVHPNLPEPTREHLAARAPAQHLRLLLANPALTTAQGETLMARRQGLASPAYARTDAWVWSENPNAAPAWLAELATARFDDPDQGAIANIATNPSTPPDTLAAIVARHAHRDYALGNPACPAAAMLDALARTPQTSPGVTTSGYAHRARRIATNPGATPAVLSKLTVEHIAGESVFDFALAHATGAEHAQMLLALAPSWYADLAALLDSAGAVID